MGKKTRKVGGEGNKKMRISVKNTLHNGDSTLQFKFQSCILTVCWLLEVDIGVAKTPPRHHVSTHSDGENGPRRAEPLEQHGLANFGVEVSHVQRGDRIAGRVCHRHSLGSEFQSQREIKHRQFQSFFLEISFRLLKFFWYFLSFFEY